MMYSAVTEQAGLHESEKFSNLRDRRCLHRRFLRDGTDKKDDGGDKVQEE